MSRSRSGVSLNNTDLYMTFVRHSTEVEYAHCMREMLRGDI